MRFKIVKSYDFLKKRRISVALAFGAKESSFINNIFTVCNLGVVLFVVVAGSILATPDNWSIAEEDVPRNGTDFGTGGFAPYGIGGIIRGAAICFYGFIGFVAYSIEIATLPRRYMLIPAFNFTLQLIGSMS